MNAQTLKIWIGLGLMSFTLGCSNQWREADEGLTAEVVQQRLAEVQQAGVLSNSGAGSQVSAMINDPSTYVFYAEGPGSLGPVGSVMSLWSFGFLGANGDFDWTEIEEGRAFFFDRFLNGQRDFGLLLGIRKFGESEMTYYALAGTGSFSGGEFVGTFSNGSSNSLVLRTSDVDGEEFETVIQLRAFDTDDNYYGKFSTLVGFTQ